MNGKGTITIGGKDRPVKFGTNQAYIFCQLQGIDLTGYADVLQRMASKPQGNEVVDLAYSALCAGIRQMPDECGFTRWDVGDWLDEAGQEQLAKLFEIMASGSIKPREEEKNA